MLLIGCCKCSVRVSLRDALVQPLAVLHKQGCTSYCGTAANRDVGLYPRASGGSVANTLLLWVFCAACIFCINLPRDTGLVEVKVEKNPSTTVNRKTATNSLWPLKAAVLCTLILCVASRTKQRIMPAD